MFPWDKLRSWMFGGKMFLRMSWDFIIKKLSISEDFAEVCGFSADFFVWDFAEGYPKEISSFTSLEKFAEGC